LSSDWKPLGFVLNISLKADVKDGKKAKNTCQH
jgi:hypothetical protein